MFKRIPTDFDIQNAILEDVPIIRRLLIRSGSKFLGQSKRTDFQPTVFMDSSATHRIVARVKPEDNEIVGYAEFKICTRLHAMNMGSWTDWFYYHFGKCLHHSSGNKITAFNTLFLTYMVYDSEYYPRIFRRMYREIFLREHTLCFILHVRRPYVPTELPEQQPSYNIFENFGMTLLPDIYSASELNNTLKIYLIHRNDVIPRMRYRRALAEDNDDIVDIIDKELPEMKKLYGDYYIAEELLANNPHKTLVVTEIDLNTVGFFWINDDVNILKLIRNFELEQYGNLLKVSMVDEARTSVVNVIEIDRRDSAQLFTSAAVSVMFAGRVSMPLYIDEEDWSSYDSLDTFIDPAEHPESNVNYVSFGPSKVCFQKMNDLANNLTSTAYYFKQRARLIRVLYSNHSPQQSNVFAIQLVGLQSSHDIREVFRFLMAAFSTCVDRDYCLFSMPAQRKMTPTVDELLKYFTRVVPRPGREIDDNLYITHRCCLFGDIIVQALAKRDVASIEELLLCPDAHRPPTSEAAVQTETFTKDDTLKMNDACESEMLLNIMHEVLGNPLSKYNVYTIRVGNTDNRSTSILIGFIILRQFKHLRSLRHHFDMPTTSESLTIAHAEVVALKLAPLFRFAADVIFREVARLSDYVDFYYFRPTKHLKHSVKTFRNDLDKKMQPIEPRRIKKQKFASTQEACETENDVGCNSKKCTSQLSYEKDRFAVYVHQLLPSKYFGSDKAIVIVGFNALCKAYLRLKIFEWNTLDFRNQQRYCCLPWYNITVITKPGVAEAEFDLHFKCATCAEQEMCWVNWSSYDSFVRDATLRMDLTKYVKFINGKISRINRKKKTVVMENDCVIYYDELILMAENDYGLPFSKTTSGRWPGNYQHINHRLDKILMYHKLQLLKSRECDDDNIKFLVYGKHLRTFEFINFLIKHGVAGKNIDLVLYVGLPIDIELKPNNPTHDLAIEMILQQMVEDLGVKVYINYEFSHWITADDDVNTIKSAVFECPFRPNLTLDCHMFISYYETTLDFRYVKVLNEAGIKLKDDKIVIDYAFRTNDPHIFAAGKSTIPNEIPRAQYLFVNVREQATKLMLAMSGKSYDHSNFDVKYHAPSYCAVQLPFDYFMVKIIMPKLTMTHLPEEDSYSLTTYHEQDFFRVRLNELDFVMEIVCITKEVFAADFLKFFCGKHELMLNHLQMRHYLRDFNNFLEYFRQPWSELIQHDLFNELQSEIRGLISPVAENILKNNKNMERKERQKLLHQTLNERGTRREIELKLLRFLRKYRVDFHHRFALPEDFPQGT